MKILLIIPAYNEEKNILKTYQEVVKYNKKNDVKLDCIVINDGSKDKTKKVLEENNIPHIDLIENLGIGGAVQTGYKYALKKQYDIAIQFDGDGQHDVTYIPKLINPIITKEYDFTIGSRFIEDISEFKTSFQRRVGIKIISFFIKLASNFKLYDTTSGFRAANKQIIEEFANNYPTEYPEPISTVEIIKKGYKVKEIGVNMKERSAGTSSIHSWKEAYYMINVCLSIIYAGLRRYK